jgi:hypothetical protein
VIFFKSTSSLVEPNDLLKFRAMRKKSIGVELAFVVEKAAIRIRSPGA